MDNGHVGQLKESKLYAFGWVIDDIYLIKFFLHVLDVKILIYSTDVQSNRYMLAIVINQR